jgi:hypothetical protein
MMTRTLLAMALVSSLSCGGVSASSADSADATATAYEDAEEYLQETGGFDQWVSLRTQMANDFYNVCGDTFCESDYSNLTPLNFSCAVTSKEGKIKSCQYIFAGSFQLVDAKTGALNITSKTFVCKVPATGTVKSLMTFLSAAGTTASIQRTLPGGTTTIYDALGGCLP